MYDVIAYLGDAAPTHALIPVIKQLQNEDRSVNIIVDANGKGKQILPEELAGKATFAYKDTPIDLDARLLITGTSVRADNTAREPDLWQSAKHKQLPVVVYVDKITESEQGKRFGEKIDVPLAFFTPNHHVSQRLQNYLSIDKNQDVVTTGNPYIESMLQNRHLVQRPKERIIPVFLSSESYMQKNGQTNQNILETIIEAAQGTDVRVLVKSHPKDDAADILSYSACVEGCGAVDHVFISEHLALGLHENEFCIGVNSTLLELAMYGGNVAVALQFSGKPDSQSELYDRLVIATDKTQGVAQIRELLTDPNEIKEVREHVRASDSVQLIDGATRRFVGALRAYY